MVEPWSIIVHGGARSIARSDHDRNRAGCRDAAAIGADVLRWGGSALDAAMQAVKALEDNPAFNAGLGSVANAEGEFELDAAIMEGSRLNIGAVAAIKGVNNPIIVARHLMNELPVLLVGEGARAFATRKGLMGDLRPDESAAVALKDSQHDTVGCVAIDHLGRMAVATSTGGLTDQMAGRVGDAPLAGCGFYVDDTIGGVAISGDGESIIRIALASRVMRRLEEHSPTHAAQAALATLARVGGEAGIIALGTDGRFGVAHNSDHFAVAMASHRLCEPRAGVVISDYEDLLSDP